MQAAAPCMASSRYSQMAADSKRTSPPTFSSGTLPSVEIAVNQAGLSARSMLVRSYGTPFSARTIAARWTYGQK